MIGEFPIYKMRHCNFVISKVIEMGIITYHPKFLGIRISNRGISISKVGIITSKGVLVFQMVATKITVQAFPPFPWTLSTVVNVHSVSFLRRFNCRNNLVLCNFGSILLLQPSSITITDTTIDHPYDQLKYVSYWFVRI